MKKLSLSCISNESLHSRILVLSNLILLKQQILLLSVMYFMQLAMIYALQHGTHTQIHIQGF